MIHIRSINIILKTRPGESRRFGYLDLTECVGEGYHWGWRGKTKIEITYKYSLLNPLRSFKAYTIFSHSYNS